MDSAIAALEERIDFWASNPHCTDEESAKMVRELEIVRTLMTATQDE